MTELAQTFGPYWPLLVLMVAGVLPNEIWRLAAALLAQRINEKSEVFVLIRLVSAALVAAVVAKLLVQPPPALSAIPVFVRLGTLALAVAIFFVAGRSMVWGMLAGVLLTIIAAIYFEA